MGQGINEAETLLGEGKTAKCIHTKLCNTQSLSGVLSKECEDFFVTLLAPRHRLVCLQSHAGFLFSLGCY